MKYTDFFDAGLTDLIPIRHGDKRPTGRWTEVQATRDDVEGWERGNLGLRTARFPCVDIDVKDAELAEAIEELVREKLGDTPVRFGREPKRAMFYRTRIPFRKKYIQFERGADESYRVEILAGGQYAVIAGLHPSGAFYRWDKPVTADNLPWVTEEAMSDLLEDIQLLVEERGWSVVGSKLSTAGDDEVDQASLRGDLDAVTATIRSLPNTDEMFPTRDDYLKVAVALKAALPDDEEQAFALFLEWSSRWTAGLNDPATVRRDWMSLRPPFRLGANYLFDLAKQVSGVSEAAAKREFSLMPLEEPDEDEDPNTELFSHAWFSNRFRKAYGNKIRYCPELGGWMRWDGSRWEIDRGKRVHEWAGAVCRESVSELKNKGLTSAAVTKHRRFAASVEAIKATLSYTEHHPDVVAGVDSFDADPWLFNTPGGVVNLRTGAMLPNDPKYLFMKQTAVTPQPIHTPKWSRFLTEVTDGDVELEAYLQRLVGYSLTGSTREHILAFLYGSGGNGKGVFLNTIVRALGTYATVAAMDTFTASRTDKHPTDLAALAGSRLVTAQETQEGRSWDEAKLKSITGGDPVTARFLFRDFFTYQPRYKILFAGNHKPRLHNVDPAMRRRFHLVPFLTTPATVNKNLTEELVSELPGILQWAVEGCIAWQKEEISPPAAVVRATESYFMEEDAPGRWMLDRLDPSPVVTSGRDLYSDWCAWCSENGEEPGSQRSLTARLRTHGVEEGRTQSARGFKLAIRSRVAAPFTHENPVDLIPIGRKTHA